MKIRNNEEKRKIKKNPRKKKETPEKNQIQKD